MCKKMNFFWITILFSSFEQVYFVFCLDKDPDISSELTSSVKLPSIDYSSINSCEDENPENLSLDLSYLGIRKINGSFFPNPDVNCLNLERNELKEVELNAFTNLENLAYLNLAKNEINVFEFLNHGFHKNLQTLILDSNPKQDEIQETETLL